MKFTKIKYKDDKVHLEYQIERDSAEPDEVQITSLDPPRKSFNNALQNLKESVCKICELPEDYSKGMTIIGLSLSYKHDILGACITAVKTLKNCNSPFTINTPHMPSEDYSGNNDKAPVLDTQAIAAIEDVIIQAEEYAKGKRLQENLFGNITELETHEN